MGVESRDDWADLIADTWGRRMAPVFKDVWFEARRHIHKASRLSADEDVFFLTSTSHMGDPAQRTDRYIHQFAADRLREHLRWVLVYGEEEDLVSIEMHPAEYRYIAYLDAIDGSAQAWSLPGAWGHVVVIQEYRGMQTDAAGNRVRRFEPRFVGVLDAEGGTATGEAAMNFVTVNMIDQPDSDVEEGDQEYEQGTDFEVTGSPVVLVGGYKANWWSRFSSVRSRLVDAMPRAHVFNTAGAPCVRKVIQNADNVIVQLTPSTLWDGAAAALVARAGGFVVALGQTEPLGNDDVWAWWGRFGFEPDADDPDRWVPAACVPPFVAGMDRDHVLAVAECCLDLPDLPATGASR